MPEVYRRMTYMADRFWPVNDRRVELASRSCSIAAGALVAEVLCLTVLLGDRLT